jgi:hypothetical protein
MIKKIIKSKTYCFFVLVGLSFFVSLWVLAKCPEWKMNIGESVVCRISTLLFLVLFLLADPVRRFLLDKDWIVCIKQIWLKIPSLYKKSFLIIFVGLNVVFLFNTVTYVIGDHDWMGVLSSRERLEGSSSNVGRYFYTFINFFFLDGYMNLPVAQNLLRFTFLSLSAVLLCYYWKLPKSCFLYSLIGLLFVLQPYVLESVCLWTNNFSYLYFFVLVGFICCDNVIRQNGWVKRVLLFMCSIISLWFSIGSYAPVVSTMAIVLLGRISIDFIFSDKNKVGIKDILYSPILSISAVVSVCLIHGGVCLYLEKVGILTSSYMTELLKFSDIPHRVLDILKCIPDYLLNYSLPFFPTSFTYLFTILFFMALVVSTIKCFEDSVSFRKKLLTVSIVVVMFFLILLACFLSSYITKINLLYASRIDFFGMMCFHIFIVVIIFNQRIKFVKNIALVICIVLVQISAVQDFYAQKIWKLSFDAEKGQWQRIISRIETMPDYRDTKDYRVLMLGTTRSYGEFFYTSGTKCERGGFIFIPHVATWYDYAILPFLVYTCHSKYGVWRQVHTNDEYNKLIKVMSEEIKNAEVFPSSKSIAIKDDIMLVVLDEKELLRVQKLLEN